MLGREYATSERLERRRQNVTGWLRGEEAWDEALAAIAETRPQRVLDAGCGDGLFTRVIAAPVVIGIDNAPAMAERAGSRGVDARVGAIEKLPFRDGEFDVVVCNWTLYHLQDLDGGVRELARVTRPGGRFVGIYNRDGHMEELWYGLRAVRVAERAGAEQLDASLYELQPGDEMVFHYHPQREELLIVLAGRLNLGRRMGGTARGRGTPGATSSGSSSPGLTGRRSIRVAATGATAL